MNNKLIHNFLKTISVLVTLALIGLAGMNYYNYTKALEEKQEKEESLAAFEKQIADLKTSIDKYAKEKDEFAKLLFNERDVPAFLDGISKSAMETKVNIITMKTQKFQEVKVPEELSRGVKIATAADANKSTEAPKVNVKKILTLSAMPIQMEVQGEFASLVAFLGQLEVYKQLLSVTNMEIDVRRDYPILHCKFLIRIYSLKSLEDLKEK